MATSYFGSTLSDLQRGISLSEAENAATQRARIAQDAQRVGAFLSAMANRERTAAERASALDRLRLQEQQNETMNQYRDRALAEDARQFDALRQAEAERLQKTLDAQKEIAGLQTQSRFDPRIFQTITELALENRDLQQEIQFAQNLSNQRKALVAQLKRLQGQKRWYSPDTEIDTEVNRLNEVLRNLDGEAAKLGLPLAMNDGYLVPSAPPTQDFSQIFKVAPAAPAAPTTSTNAPPPLMSNPTNAVPAAPVATPAPAPKEWDMSAFLSAIGGANAPMQSAPPSFPTSSNAPQSQRMFRRRFNPETLEFETVR